MKGNRWFVWVLGLLLVLCCVAGLAEERTFQSGESTLTYEVKKDMKTGEQYAVIKSVTAVPDLVIPGEVEGIPVQKIESKGAFSVIG